MRASFFVCTPARFKYLHWVRDGPAVSDPLCVCVCWADDDDRGNEGRAEIEVAQRAAAPIDIKDQLGKKNCISPVVVSTFSPGRLPSCCPLDSAVSSPTRSNSGSYQFDPGQRKIIKKNGFLYANRMPWSSAKIKIATRVNNLQRGKDGSLSSARAALRTQRIDACDPRVAFLPF